MSSWFGGEMSGRNSAYDIEWNTSLGGLSATPLNRTLWYNEDRALVDWGDGTPIEVFDDNQATHTYASHGTYRIRQWAQNNRSPSEQPLWRIWRWAQRAGVTQLINFGRTRHYGGGYNSMLDLFVSNSNMRATYLQEGPPPPDQSYALIYRMFEATIIGNGGEYNPAVWTSWHIDDWATSIAGFFRHINNSITKAGWNPDLSGWNPYRNTSLLTTFAGCQSFNRDISGWNTANVTNLYGTFQGAWSFNQPIGSWNTSNVTDIRYCFSSASNFNQDIGNWDVSKTTSMISLFGGCYSFNNGGSTAIGSWDTSGVTDFSATFRSAENFNQPIGSWDVSLGSFYQMFYTARAFNQDLGAWSPGASRASASCNMYGMFHRAVAFNNGGSTAIDSWDTSKVFSMQNMFAESPFNQPIGSWNVSNVNNMSYMFQFSTGYFNQDIGSWDVSKVTTFSEMFRNNWGFNQDISSWSLWFNSSTGVPPAMSNMLTNSGLSVENYSKWLIRIANDVSDRGQSASSAIGSLGATNKKYNTNTYTGIGSGTYTDAPSAKGYLLGLGWTIADGGTA